MTKHVTLDTGKIGQWEFICHVSSQPGGQRALSASQGHTGVSEQNEAAGRSEGRLRGTKRVGAPASRGKTRLAGWNHSVGWQGAETPA